MERADSAGPEPVSAKESGWWAVLPDYTRTDGCELRLERKLCWRCVLCFFFYGVLDCLYHSSLSLRTGLLRTLECDERHLEIVRSFLQRFLILGLYKIHEHHGMQA